MEFDPVLNSANHLSVKWDEAITKFGDDAIALSVADMDIRAPRAVVDAITARAQVGAYSYTYVPETYYAEVQRWLAQRHSWEVPAAAITYVPRVVQAVSVVLDELTRPGDSVLVHSPSYGPITNLVEELGRRLAVSELRLREGRYEVDFAETERLMADCKVLLLCSPHNPSGRVWTRSELARFAEMAERHDVLIVSDDVHADIVASGQVYVPIASLDEATAKRTITMTSPAKPFNLAGLEIANMVIENDEIRQQIEAALKRRGFHNPSYFAVVALEAAYRHGEPWLVELQRHIAKNLAILREFLALRMPAIRLVDPEGTYLAWLDCREWSSDEEVISQWMRDARVSLCPGSSFGSTHNGFARMNIAVSEEILRTALDRLGVAYECNTKENCQ